MFEKISAAISSVSTFSDFLASLNKNAGKRGKQFELFVRWFLRNDPEWATQVGEIWLWEDYPDRWGVDCGIDLVFRHKNGETWAVQAKCYSAEHDITKHDVDKFLSESNRECIAKRLLIATTDRIGANARQVCEAQEKTVVRYMLSNFESADIEYPASFADLHNAKPKAKPQPRDHQVEAIGVVVKNFQDVDRGQLIMACGTGKTFTTLWIKENLFAHSTLVLLPSLGLLSQTLHEWTLAASQPFDVLCVCSDQTVGKRGDDEVIHSVADLGFPVTSDTAEIRRFLICDSAKVVFSTYQSSPLIADAQEDQSIHPFDLVVADEAHRCAGKIGGDFSTVLDSSRIRARKRLFATATPRTYSTNVKRVAEGRGLEVVGMDDEAVFGKALYSLPFGEAIKRELLTDYRVVIIGVDSPMIADWIHNRELLKTDSGIENDAESLAAQIGLLKAFKDYDLKRVISFHSRVARAEAFTQDMRQVFNWIGGELRPSGVLTTDFVTGAMPTDKRRRKLAQLKAMGPDERGLLSNARCLSEGVDVPSLDGVAFIDPRSSQIDIIQAVGRAIRLSTNKSAGTIVLPVFIEEGDSPTKSIEASNFKPIWDVLNALKAHDDVLSAELDQIRTELGRKTGSSIDSDVFSKITVDLPSSVDISFGHSLRTFLLERVTDPWEFWYGLLQQYSASNRGALVLTSLTLEGGQFLGKWVSHQRNGKERLSPERRTRLEAIKGWTWNPIDEQWELGFSYLQEYATAHGSCLVPAKFRLVNGFGLGNWVSHQRLSREDLPADRKDRLDALQGWSWNPHTEKWDIGFQYLKEYSEKHGDCLVLATLKTPDGYPLGNWLTRQRYGRDELSSERRAKLETLAGWTWTAMEDEWGVGYKFLQSFVAKNGHCSVPQDSMQTNGFRLGAWIRNQRVRKERLPPERRAKLEALTGWSWSPMKDAWETGFRKLKEYASIHGDCLVPNVMKMDDGYPLGQWVAVQRLAQAAMSSNRRARLESLVGWAWSVKRRRHVVKDGL